MLEEFRAYKSNIEVSNMGNVKRNGSLVKLSKDEHYYCVSVDGIPERVHVIVGKLFPEICGEYKKYYHYHHINHNQLDNRAENIICLSPSEHRKLHQKEEGVSKAVKAYDLKGNYIGRRDSKTQASEATGVDYRHITECFYGQTNRVTAGKKYWFPEEMSEDEVQSRILEIKSQKYRRKSLTV